MLVSAPAPAAPCDYKRLTRIHQVPQQLGGFIVIYHRAGWNRNNQVRRGFSGLVGRSPVFPVFRAEYFVVVKFVQRVQRRDDLQNHAAALTSVASVWSASRSVFFTVAVHQTIAAFAGLYCNRY